MIWILLQSESPWKRNDAITFFFIFVFNFSVPGVFLRNRLRGYVPAASITAKFEQILLEGFGNNLKRGFKNHKNSEIACYPHKIF